MSDDKKDDQNEQAIKKVVKKSVSDVFGPEEEETPEPPTSGYPGYPRGYEAPRHEGQPRQPSFLWEKEQNPGYAFQRQKATSLLGGGVQRGDLARDAAWGKPQDKRLPGITKKLNDKGEMIGVHFTIEAWARLRSRVLKRTLIEMDFERIVLSVDDHTRLEQALHDIMARSAYQIGEPGDSFRKGTLKQVSIWIGDRAPEEPKPLPASAVDEDGADTKPDDEWGPGDDDENPINIRTGEHNDEPSDTE